MNATLETRINLALDDHDTADEDISVVTFHEMRRIMGIIEIPVCYQMAMQAVERVARLMGDSPGECSFDSVVNILGGNRFTHAYA